MDSAIEEQPFTNAASLWEYLSVPPTLSDTQNEVIYRGHADAKWKLLPTILRHGPAKILRELIGRPLTYADQAWVEFVMLRLFVRGCDEAGVAVPNDSVRFRDTNLSDRNVEEYYKRPDTWPSEDLVETMAMARLHGLPTRLLDWTTDPFVALYFAVSEALRRQSHWAADDHIAVFALDKGKRANTHCGDFRVLRVRGSISQNIVAQKGLFTIHPIHGNRASRVAAKSLEEYLRPPTWSPIRKLIVPVKECVKLYELCRQFSYNAARLYPSAEGASMYVAETQYHILGHAAIGRFP